MKLSELFSKYASYLLFSLIVIFNNAIYYIDSTNNDITDVNFIKAILYTCELFVLIFIYFISFKYATYKFLNSSIVAVIIILLYFGIGFLQIKSLIGTVITALAIFIPGLDLKRIIQIYGVVAAIFFLITLSAYNSYQLADFEVIRSATGVVRHSLGFTHPNVVPVMLLPVVVGISITLEKRYFRLLSIIVTAVAANWLNEVTGSRAGVYTLVLMSVLSFIPTIHFKEKIKKILGYLPIVFFFFSVSSAFLLKDSIINDLLSNRLILWYLYLRSSVPVIGNGDIGKISFADLSGTLALDNVYVFTLKYYGIIFTAIILLALCLLMRKLLFKQQQLLIIFFICYLIYGCFESRLFDSPINAFVPFSLASLFEYLSDSMSPRDLSCSGVSMLSYDRNS